MLSIIFGWLRTRTGSIWPASLAHSATNAVGGSLTLLLFTGGPNWIFVSYVGVLGWVPLGILCAWIVLTGQLGDSSASARASKPKWSADTTTSRSKTNGRHQLWIRGSSPIPRVQGRRKHGGRERRMSSKVFGGKQGSSEENKDRWRR